MGDSVGAESESAREATLGRPIEQRIAEMEAMADEVEVMLEMLRASEPEGWRTTAGE